MEQFEMEIWVKPTKRLEFKQTLNDLNVKLQKYCTRLEISVSDNGVLFSIIAQWRTAFEMQEAIKMQEFEILSGAITALSEKTEIKLNNKLIDNLISTLTNIKNKL